jgi:hypothetical protein
MRTLRGPEEEIDSSPFDLPVLLSDDLDADAPDHHDTKQEVAMLLHRTLLQRMPTGLSGWLRTAPRTTHGAVAVLARISHTGSIFWQKQRCERSSARGEWRLWVEAIGFNFCESC